MFNYEVFAACSALRMLRERAGFLSAMIGSRANEALPDADRTEIFGFITFLHSTFDALACNAIEMRLRHFEAALHRIFTWGVYEYEIKSTLQVIEDELWQHKFYHYPQDKAALVLSLRANWDRTIRAFPLTHGEVHAAVDCYALGHNTASVFHSMRVAEHGLRSLAKERKVRLAKNKPVEWGTWHDIIKALDDEIKVIGGKKAGVAKDAALEFYSGARAELNGFKDEYRNLVMHVRSTYDEHRALRALTNVNTFMERLAAKIDHDHHRIRWGLR